jgi:hypothetical protein
MNASTTSDANVPHYRSYLLRLWCEASDRRWRASLEETQTGKRIGFASLEQLFVYLMGQADSDLKGASMKQSS